MSVDFSEFPVGSSTILGFALWAGVSWFATGQMVGERMIELSGWQDACTQNLVAQVERQAPPSYRTPRTDCSAVLGSFLPELDQLCRGFGNPDLASPEIRQLRNEIAQAEARHHQRLSRVAEAAPNQCKCAASVVLEDRLPWALHAGSARLITPSEIKHLDQSLSQALHTPLCAGGAS